MNEQYEELIKAVGAVGTSAAELRKEFGVRLDQTERKLRVNAHCVSKVARAQALQQEQIDELKRRLDKLAEEGDAVVARHGPKVAMDRNITYNEIDAMRVNRRYALRALHEAGVVCRSTEGKYTTPVRAAGHGVVRAVVILMDKEDAK